MLVTVTTYREVVFVYRARLGDDYEKFAAELKDLDCVWKIEAGGAYIGDKPSPDSYQVFVVVAWDDNAGLSLYKYLKSHPSVQIAI